MKLRIPISPEYLWNGNICLINQLFGENKNATLSGGVSYGPQGHTGIDFKTTGRWKYERGGLWKMSEDGRWLSGHWVKDQRTKEEENGRIPLYAMHDGKLSLVLNPDKERQGWGLYVTAEPCTDVQYRTLYWHIETPWQSLMRFDGMIWKTIKRDWVRAGGVVAIAGNNGMSNGPHVHVELQKREMYRGNWGEWQKIDPMPYLTESTDVVYQRNYGMSDSDWFYMGKKITREEADKILNSLPKVI